MMLRRYLMLKFVGCAKEGLLASLVRSSCLPYGSKDLWLLGR